MSKAALPSPEEWGHRAMEAEATPEEIVRELVGQTEHAVHKSAVELGKPERCKDRRGYYRATFTIPVTPKLFDQLMNSANGYRAHYAVSIEAGEAFNRRLLQSIGPMIIFSENIYKAHLDRYQCNSSLLGASSYIWYPKELSGRLAKRRLQRCDEELRVSRWADHWKDVAAPRKGLLAPIPESAVNQIYGTFINHMCDPYDQEPDRARVLHETGWI